MGRPWTRRFGFGTWLLTLGICALSATHAGAKQEPDRGPYIHIAEIQIDPTRLDAFRAAVTAQIEAAIRLEPGVLTLYAVHDKSNPARVRVFEIYADEAAYLAHIQAPHFHAYKAAVQDIVKSLDLLEAKPIALGSKSR